MTDIIERLRAPLYPREERDEYLERDRREAADEIERLRSILKITVDAMAAKKWAWEICQGWSYTKPADKEGDPPQHVPWDFRERMRRADELVVWLVTPPEAST